MYYVQCKLLNSTSLQTFSMQIPPQVSLISCTQDLDYLLIISEPNRYRIRLLGLVNVRQFG